jgi:hypothetical protein
MTRFACEGAFRAARVTLLMVRFDLLINFALRDFIFLAEDFLIGDFFAGFFARRFEAFGDDLRIAFFVALLLAIRTPW